MSKEYSVEKVVARRVRAGKIEYCVKWKNFPASHNTWEPEKHLTGCAILLENFKKEGRRQPVQRGADRHVSEDSSSDGDGDQEFVVEAVVNRRIRSGQVQYEIKWKGFPATSNTWEPQANLNCDALIEKYEKSTIKKDLTKEKARMTRSGRVVNPAAKLLSPSTRSSNRRLRPVLLAETEVKLEHNQDGQQPTSIVGATDSLGELAFLMRWPNGAEQLVPATTANREWPQMVIGFYENRISWHDAPLSASDLRAGRATASATLAAGSAGGPNVYWLKYM